MRPRRIASSRDLGSVEIGHRPTHGWLVLPALLAVHSLEQHPVVLVARQRLACIADAAVRLPAVAVRPVLTGGHADDQNLAAVAQGHAIDGREGRRIDRAQLLGDLFDGVIADLLADDSPVRLNAKQ